MAWVKGQSGNPAGRARSETGRAAVREWIKQRLPAILRKLEKLALAGDVQAARLLLDRTLPPLRPEASPVVLPGVSTAANFTEQALALIRAATSGQVDPDTAARLLAGIAASARTPDIDDWARRLAALEALEAERQA